MTVSREAKYAASATKKRRPKAYSTQIHTLRALLTPTLSDFLFLALLYVLFASGPSGWASLLADGDTGWHIRTGDLVLSTGSVPTHDPFSFSKPQAPWFAWEWLADVIFSLAHSLAGLKGVVFLSGFVICLAAMIVFRYTIWRGADVGVALILVVLATDASRMHFLARPHIFTLLLFPVSLWILDRDGRQHDRVVWTLVPLTALWTNLHGGFLALIACIFLTCLGRGRQFAQTRRYATLGALCCGATLLNPYGYRLHTHLWEYMRSGWIATAIIEFQPPQFHSEGMYKFGILLVTSLALIPLFLRRRRFEDGLLVLFWAYEALHSVRHIPLFCTVAVPRLGEELTRIRDGWSRTGAKGSIRAVLDGILRDFAPGARRTSIWAAAMIALLWFSPTGQRWPMDFPSSNFPVALVTRNLDRLQSQPTLSSDYWGGYLIYRGYPQIRVFIDGRSDFYGAALGEQYVKLFDGGEGWHGVLDSYQFRLALVPRDRPLAELLKQDPQWAVIDSDKLSLLFERKDQV